MGDFEPKEGYKKMVSPILSHYGDLVSVSLFVLTLDLVRSASKSALSTAGRNSSQERRSRVDRLSRHTDSPLLRHHNLRKQRNHSCEKAVQSVGIRHKTMTV